jgi:hypothetical protein
LEAAWKQKFTVMVTAFYSKLEDIRGTMAGPIVSYGPGSHAQVLGHESRASILCSVELRRKLALGGTLENFI